MATLDPAPIGPPPPPPPPAVRPPGFWWRVLSPPGAVVVAFGFSALIGIFFGLWPAKRAASLDPIQALRYE